MNSKTIIFLHIPKTGGRSLQNILLRQYSDDEIVVDAHSKLDEIANWSDERKRSLRYVQGHFVYGVHNMLPQECSYITMLREPVDRVISHYYFIKRSVSHPLNRVVQEQDIGLKEYVTSGICAEASNDQARLIAGVSRDSAVDVNDMLKMAKENVDKSFIIAGLVEQFDETLMLLKRKLGLRNIFYGVRNQTIGRPLYQEIPEEVRGLIREVNYADMELYAYARAKMADMIAQQGPSFTNQVNRFRHLNQPYSNVFSLIRRVKNRIVSRR